MGTSSYLLKIFRLLYPLPEPPQARTKDLQILCLGLPRSGTDSLRQALLRLGYHKVAHGFDWWIDNPGISYLYAELALLRSQGRLPEAETLRMSYFDRTLGEYEATTDVPGAWFPEELLQAYPDAKVILNKRRDVASWKASFRESVLPILESWRYWFFSWFEPELFWAEWITLELHGRELLRGNFERHAEQAHLEHYERLERALDRDGRPFLAWSVEDGW